VRAGTTEELRKATLVAADGADAVIMAAAPADFRPATVAANKIKKAEGAAPPVIELVENPDIAAELGERKRPGQLLVAFAAETRDALAHGRAKLARKRADMIVINEVGAGKAFGRDTNTAVVVTADGAEVTLGERGKDELADAVLDLVVERLSTPIG
jgi:phosphopantothenoylcysteine decarboxylase/phosphopantothenate--cysteine ligase